jgi:hypothetical protein
MLATYRFLIIRAATAQQMEVGPSRGPEGNVPVS